MRIQKIVAFRSNQEFIDWQRKEKRKIINVRLTETVIQVLYEEIEQSNYKNVQKFTIDEIREFAYLCLQVEDDSIHLVTNERLIHFMDQLDRADSFNILNLIEMDESERLSFFKSVLTSNCERVDI